MGKKGNQQISDVHFRKDWARHVRLWLNQPGKKKARRHARKVRAAAIAPRPTAGNLHPLVRPGGRKHNFRERIGRGFTLEEVKKAGINVGFARTIGISVDHRRKNRSEPLFLENVQRLKNYRARVVLLPKAGANKRKVRKNPKIKVRPVKSVASAEEQKNAVQLVGAVAPGPRDPRAAVAQQSRVIKPDERLAKNSAYLRLRRARADARLAGERKRRVEIRAKKAEALAATGGGKGTVVETE